MGMSGTSMAAPHVAGVAALVWGEMGPGARGAEVAARVLQGATRGVVTDAKGTAPALAYNQP